MRPGQLLSHQACRHRRRERERGERKEGGGEGRKEIRLLAMELELQEMIFFPVAYGGIARKGGGCQESLGTKAL